MFGAGRLGAGGAMQVVIVSASPLLIRPKQPLTSQVCKFPRTARTLQLVHAVGVGDLGHAVVRDAAGPPVTKLCQAVTPTGLRAVPILPDRSMAPWESRSPMVG